MGEPAATASVVQNEQACCCHLRGRFTQAAGTGNYKFIWGMAGENQAFDDMDAV